MMDYTYLGWREAFVSPEGAVDLFMGMPFYFSR
jgi:hypothetical protein